MGEVIQRLLSRAGVGVLVVWIQIVYYDGVGILVVWFQIVYYDGGFTLAHGDGARGYWLLYEDKLHCLWHFGMENTYHDLQILFGMCFVSRSKARGCIQDKLVAGHFRVQSAACSPANSGRPTRTAQTHTHQQARQQEEAIPDSIRRPLQEKETR